MHSLAFSGLFDGKAAASAVVAGLLLGATCAFKVLTTGEVLSAWQSTKHSVSRPSLASAMFILGMMLSGAIMPRAFGGFEPLPPRDLGASDHTRYLLRLAVGGLLLGVGAALGDSDCAKHGLSGLAQLDPRSGAAVSIMIFMAITAASLTGTLTASPPDFETEEELPDLDVVIAWALGATSALAAAAAALLVARRRVGLEAAARYLTVPVELLCGLMLGVAMSIGGLARPSKIAAAFDIGSGKTDPSLLCAASALAVALPFFLVLRRFESASPLLAASFASKEASAEAAAAASALAAAPKLEAIGLLGAGAFGVGWGLCGMSMAQVWVLLGSTPSPDILMIVFTMLLGMGTCALIRAVKDNKQCDRVAPLPGDASRVQAPQVVSVVPKPSALALQRMGDSEGNEVSLWGSERSFPTDDILSGL